MSRLPLVIPRVRTLSYALIAVVAFSVGGATVVQAVAPGGIMGVVQLADRTDNTHLAAVDANGNLAVSVMNAPTVSIAGTPTVKVARQPFQQFVSAASAQGNEGCAEVVVPVGMRLKVEAFSADAQETNGNKPSVYLLVFTTNGDLWTSVRPVLLDLHFSRAYWAGDVQTALFTGSGLSGDGLTYSIKACVAPGVVGDESSFRGFVSGYLEPLS